MIKRTFKMLLGIVALAIGILGILVPILPGFPFIFAAILLFSPEKGKTLIAWIKVKFRSLSKKQA